MKFKLVSERPVCSEEKFFCLNDQEALSRFEATFMGALVGECMGHKFEGMWGPNLAEIIDDFKQIKRNTEIGAKLTSTISYSIDSVTIDKIDTHNGDIALAFSLTESLIHSKDFDPITTAFFFQDRYLKNPLQGFSTSNISVCRKLNRLLNMNELHNYFMFPASELFNGQGSYGSSAAMRCFPIALFTYYKPLEEMIITCELQTRLTHTHMWAIIGSQLQCFAIREVLNSNSTEHSFDFDSYFLNILNFVMDLEKGFKFAETLYYTKIDTYSNVMQKNLYSYFEQKERMPHSEDRKSNSYFSGMLFKLYKVLEKCRKGEVIRIRQIFEKNIKEGKRQFLNDFYLKKFKHFNIFKGVSSVHSILMGLSCFIIACDPKCSHEVDDKLNCVNSHELYSPMERVIFYAISTGGELETICSLAGSIVGAFYGKKSIPRYLFEKCESYEGVENLARQLFEISVPSKM